MIDKRLGTRTWSAPDKTAGPEGTGRPNHQPKTFQSSVWAYGLLHRHHNPSLTFMRHFTSSRVSLIRRPSAGLAAGRAGGRLVAKSRAAADLFRVSFGHPLLHKA